MHKSEIEKRVLLAKAWCSILGNLTSYGSREHEDTALMVEEYSAQIVAHCHHRCYTQETQNGTLPNRETAGIVASKNSFFPSLSVVIAELKDWTAENERKSAQKSLPPPSSRMETWLAFCNQNNVSGMDKVVGKVLIAKIAEIKDELPNHNKPLPEQETERAKRIEFHKRLMAQNYVTAYSALVECCPDMSLDREDTSMDWKDRRRLATTLRGIAEPTMHPQATRLLGMVRQAVAKLAPDNMDMVEAFEDRHRMVPAMAAE